MARLASDKPVSLEACFPVAHPESAFAYSRTAVGDTTSKHPFRRLPLPRNEKSSSVAPRDVRGSSWNPCVLLRLPAAPTRWLIQALVELCVGKLTSCDGAAVS